MMQVEYRRREDMNSDSGKGLFICQCLTSVKVCSGGGGMQAPRHPPSDNTSSSTLAAHRTAVEATSRRSSEPPVDHSPIR